MREQDALRKAAERARKTMSDRFVIWCPEETDAPGEHYHIATDETLETFYMGLSDASIVACFGPDGERC